jgi:hypothetical protein
MLVTMLAAVVLMADTPAAAEATSQPAAPAAPPVSARKKLTREGMICRNEPVLGSKMPKRVCMTASEAAERQKADRELTERIQASTRAATGN